MKKVFLTSNDVEVIIRTKLKGKLKWGLCTGFKLYLADGEYYAPPKKDVQRVLKETTTNQFQWTKETFDCDDFAKVLCAEFAKDAYRNSKRRPPYCLGFVWGKLPGPHAINWFIDSKKELYFIEPQTDGIFLPRKTDKGIWLMVA